MKPRLLDLFCGADLQLMLSSGIINVWLKSHASSALRFLSLKGKLVSFAHGAVLTIRNGQRQDSVLAANAGLSLNLGVLVMLIGDIAHKPVRRRQSLKRLRLGGRPTPTPIALISRGIWQRTLDFIVIGLELNDLKSYAYWGVNV